MNILYISINKIATQFDKIFDCQ